MKQIITEIKDCRRCPYYCFQSRYPGGIEFACDIKGNYQDKLIPMHKLDKISFIHDDCPLEDKEIEYDESEHIKCEHREVTDDLFSKDFCIKKMHTVCMENVNNILVIREIKMNCPKCSEEYISTDSHYDEADVLISEINKCRMKDCGFEWSPVNLQNEFYRCPVCNNHNIWKDIKNPEKQGCHSCGSQFGLTSVKYEKENLIKEIGDQLVSLSAYEAKDLRAYIIQEHDLVVGHIERVIGEKSMNKDDEYDYPCFYYSDEFSHWFRGLGGATNE